MSTLISNDHGTNVLIVYYFEAPQSTDAAGGGNSLTVPVTVESTSIGLGGASSPDYSGPRFSAEPPFWVEFSNSSGAELTCEATGDPPLTLIWVSADGEYFR